jgi:hypothetical protein
MNLEIETEATQFSEKEYINGISLAVYRTLHTINERKTDLIQLKANIILAKIFYVWQHKFTLNFEENANVVTLQLPI